VQFFEPDKDYSDHPAFKALSGVSLGDVWFPFGFFLAKDEEGKTFVLPGTEEVPSQDAAQGVSRY
jgi:hypothetical protein